MEQWWGGGGEVGRARQGGEGPAGGRWGGVSSRSVPGRSFRGDGCEMAMGREKRISLGEWKEENVGLLIGATGEASRERTSRIPVVKISLSMAKESPVHVRKKIEEEEDLVGPV